MIHDATVCCALLQRARTSTLFLSDAGAFRRLQLLSYPEPELQWSLFYAAGSPAAAVLLLTLHAAAATALLIGWRTQTATFLCWMGWASASQRVGALACEADTLLRLALLWGCFLPVSQSGLSGHECDSRPASCSFCTVAFVDASRGVAR